MYSLLWAVGTARGGFQLFSCSARLSIHPIRRVLARLIPKTRTSVEAIYGALQISWITRSHCATLTCIRWLSNCNNKLHLSITESSSSCTWSCKLIYVFPYFVKVAKLMSSGILQRTWSLEIISNNYRKEQSFPSNLFVHLITSGCMSRNGNYRFAIGVGQCVMCKVQAVGRCTAVAHCNQSESNLFMN